MNENVEYVKKVLPKPVLFVQLAEECDELGQAALKMFRILDGRNPTPIPIEQAIEKVFEEIADILGLRLATVNTQLSRGRAQLKTILEQEGFV